MGAALGGWHTGARRPPRPPPAPPPTTPPTPPSPPPSPPPLQALVGVEEQAAALQAFVDELKTMPVAVQTDAANEQHYEVPTAYFQAVLGHHLKYSCCLYESPSSTLEEAEVAALALVCERAGLADGQDVLELGCGWGSLSLFMAAKFPGSSILAVSNSRTQKVTGRGGGGGLAGGRAGGSAREPWSAMPSRSALPSSNSLFRTHL